jgi:two-component system phosphate regulon sensor histidine kinase PhoR
MHKRGHPPRTLLAAIVGITVIPLALLLWLGWRFLEQDRILERQQAQDRLERSADLVIGAVQRSVSASEQRLATGAAEWPEGAVALTLERGRIEAHPRNRLAYVPDPPSALERKRDHIGAIRMFSELAGSRDRSVRAGALLRLARNLKATSRFEQALAAYERLAALDSVPVAGAPAALAARYARCKLLEETGRRQELRSEAQELAGDLHTARWVLSGPVYWLYAADVDAWTGRPPVPLEPETFARAAEAFAAKWERLDDSGRDLLRIDGQPVTVLWHRSGASGRALLAVPSFVERNWLLPAANIAGEHQIHLGLDGGAAEHRATRSPSDTGLPWTLTAWPESRADAGGFTERRRLLIAGFTLLVLLALTAGYLIYRAVRREFAVARLQSDFVAAVSHEFRTPLTTLRQFTDMLRDGAAIDDDRRTLCYEAQSRATDRLTRLVESLLDFGRMEAGSRPYRFERCDCAELTRRAVEEFRTGQQAAGYDIELGEELPETEIDADPEALSRAVANLLENAVKYSPDSRAVQVAVSRRNGSVAISIRDRGMGIPPREQRLIFGQFQRGEQARRMGIKGTGIGLAMVDHIVRAHRGRVEVESQPGEGSTFTLVLPARTDQ